MPKTELAIKTYPALLSQLKTVFIEGMQRIEKENFLTQIYANLTQIHADIFISATICVQSANIRVK